MSYASLAIETTSGFPVLDAELLTRLRQAGRRTVWMLGFAGKSVVAAALTWLILAGPSVLAN